MSNNQRQLRPNEKRADTAIVFMWIMIVVYLIFTLTPFPITEDFIINNLATVLLVAIAFLALFIYQAVTYIRWFRRAYFNLRILTHGQTEHTDGWAAAAWLIPIVHLFMPFIMMNELFQKSSSILRRANSTMQHHLNADLVLLFWIFWILSAVTSTIVSFITWESEIATTIINLTNAILSVAVGLVSTKIIKQYSAVEPELNRIYEQETNLSATPLNP